MTFALLAIIEIVTLVLVIYLLVRKPPASEQDPRVTQLAEQLTRLDARAQAGDENSRSALAQMRTDIAAEAQRSREASASDFANLRTEITGSITTLGTTLQNGLNSFREDNTSSNGQLRGAVQQQLDTLTQRLTSFTSETTRSQTEIRESLNTKLNELMTGNATHQEQLRSAVEARLDKLNTDNAAKLEQMRATVDEKLQSTLQTRLTESFGQVSDQLKNVHTGLGEMKELATGVGDLKKVLSNVSRRGGVGEFLVEQQLEQMFSPEQYLKQANIRPNTAEKVDFALKFPNGEDGKSVLLPIDAKFPTSDWERLENAYDHGTADEIARTGKEFERAIRAQAKSISEKYIYLPKTMPHAIMVLPTEGLYAEVVRHPGLLSEVQSTHHVTIAGPSTFMAILTSFQMGFHTLAIQKKGDEVWRILSTAKDEFQKFGGLMEKVERNVGTVQKTLKKISGKTKTINRVLKNVTSNEAIPEQTNLVSIDEPDGAALRIAASVEER